ncbi:hypothetical protein NA56DRAFT_708040 [Hyaloscypha hepaticicola]|uniref:Uncharacterized protein n=1 Tax=Hyaloscypha hepaticicola TaxID=2082293 RepID=A0A2J6PT06_9HELO|nr:hypothetical protein NA56DRAFT_708040 [Hyaloscypha hepaticicola]
MPVRYAHVTPEHVTTKRLLNPHHSGSSCSTVGSNGRDVSVLFFDARTGSGLASGGSIGFVALFLGRVSTRSGDCCFEDSARVFALARRTRFGIAWSEGASPAKRLDQRPPAMWNSFLTKPRLD